jgi:hypothetical protein
VCLSFASVIYPATEIYAAFSTAAK